MQLFEVIRWGNGLDDPIDGGPDGADTCLLVRAASVEQAAALADRELAHHPAGTASPCATAVYLLGTDAGTQADARILRGPYLQAAYRHGWRHWYREQAGAPWQEAPEP